MQGCANLYSTNNHLSLLTATPPALHHKVVSTRTYQSQAQLFQLTFT